MEISVIIPAYNRESLLPVTLRSLLAQTLPADEIIVVDDGSKDLTVEVAESFGNPVRVVRQKNAGPAAARDRGFAESSGKFIHFFDSDDVAMPNKHEVQVEALKEKGADIAYCPWVKGMFTEEGFVPQNHMLQLHGLPDGDLVRALLTDWSVVPHTCMFRRQIVEKIGGFGVELFSAEDQMMFLKCLLAGARVVHTPDTFELYRVGTANKITEAKDGGQSQVREWGKFLVDAAQACRELGIDPAQWFGFRRRVWEVEDDMRRLRMDEHELMKALRGLHSSRVPSILYWAEREIGRKRSGLQQRLTGGRANRTFKAGPLSSAQLELIATALAAIGPCQPGE